MRRKWKFPGGVVVGIRAFVTVAQVKSLVEELRSYESRGSDK